MKPERRKKIPFDRADRDGEQGNVWGEVVGTANNHYLSSVANRCFAITGQCWITRNELTSKIEELGGTVGSRGAVTSSTDVLIRGFSGQWKHGEYGTKEADAARQIRGGRRLLVVDDDEFKKLVLLGQKARCLDYVAGELIDWIAPCPDRSEFEAIAKIQGTLDREATQKGRTEQAYLRSRLFQDPENWCCHLCGLSLPGEILIAGHIKARCDCSDAERRDADNIVFSVCLLGCDVLYERGFVSVDESGRIVTVSQLPSSKPLLAKLKQLDGRRCKAWRESTRKYFAWHFARRFRG